MSGPLHGIRVLELGSFIAGPYAGQLLADLGADVIKIESPKGGDPMRTWGTVTVQGQSLWWPVLARNKRSLSLDLHHSEAQDLVRQLASEADVLLENFKPGVLEHWNLDPEQLRATYPKLVVARVSGFGQTGPYSSRAGFGSVAEAMGGLRNLVGFPDREPPRVGISIADTLAGMFAAMGVISALYQRDVHSGRGQTVDVALTEAVLAVLESVVSEYSVTGQVRQRTGSILPKLAPSNLYPTQDNSWVLIGANADKLFRGLAKAMERPELAQDERYASHIARGEHQLELDLLIANWTRTLPRAEILRRMEEHGIPAGPLYDAADIVADPHFQARGAVVQVETPNLGTLSMSGVMPRLSETPGEIRWTGPRLGQHNIEILQGLLNLDQEQLSRLQAAGIIGATDLSDEHV